MSAPPPRQRQVHDVKCAQPYFDQAWAGHKPFEVRKDDRDYQSGDVLIQREFDGRFYGTRATIHVIGYVLRDFPGLRRNYCAFGLLDPTEDDCVFAGWPL